MVILIADDDPVSCCLLKDRLVHWGHEVVTTDDGGTAWEVLRSEPAPALAILDWQMPVFNGPEICRLAQLERFRQRPYLILLSARTGTADIVTGLSSGADDFAKPFHDEELQARVNVGIRILELQRSLSARVRQLEAALAQIKQLQGLLPICMYCKKIRDDHNYWQQVEAYFASHTAAQFSHGICPDCFEHFVRPQLSNPSEEREI